MWRVLVGVIIDLGGGRLGQRGMIMLMITLITTEHVHNKDGPRREWSVVSCVSVVDVNYLVNRRRVSDVNMIPWPVTQSPGLSQCNW